MSGPADDFWEARFQANTVPWERGGLHPAFLDWRERGVLAPCRLIVPGAGRSPEPRAMLDAGFDVVTLDLAASAVAFQAEALGSARAVAGDVTAWEAEAPFDAAYDQTCLCALPPGLRAGYERRLRRWVRPGGRLFLLMMRMGRAGGPPFDCPDGEMQALFGGWEWPEAVREGYGHAAGGVEVPVVLGRPG